MDHCGSRARCFLDFGQFFSSNGSTFITILFVEHKDVYGGGQKHLVNLSAELSRLGHRVSVVSSPNALLKEALQASNIPVQQFSLGRIRKGTGVVALARNFAWRIVPTASLVRQITIGRVDIVCANDMYSLIACLLAAKVASRKLAVIFHNVTYPASGITRFLLRRADSIVAVSNAVRMHLSDIEPTVGPRTTVIHNAVHFTQLPERQGVRQEWRRKYGIPETSLVIGSVGRLSPEKNQSMMLEAFAALAREFDRLRFIIVGDGPLAPVLRAQAADLGLNGKIVFTGHQGNVLEWLTGFDIFVLPSLAEGFPLTVLEAMHAGLPVIASRVGGIPEQMEHGITGLLIPPGDPVAFEASLRSLITDERQRSSIAVAGQERVHKLFNVESMVRRYEELFLGVVG